MQIFTINVNKMAITRLMKKYCFLIKHIWISKPLLSSSAVFLLNFLSEVSFFRKHAHAMRRVPSAPEQIDDINAPSWVECNASRMISKYARTRDCRFAHGHPNSIAYFCPADKRSGPLSDTQRLVPARHLPIDAHERSG
jgi:hypothetical protein